MAIEEVLSNLANILPGDLVSKLEFLVIFVQALGGIIVVYIIFTVIKFFIIRKEEKMLEKIMKDVKYIKNKLKKKKIR